MYLIRIFCISVCLIVGLFNGISGYFLSVLSLMYILNILMINLNLSIVYIILGCLSIVLYFKIPKTYISKLNLLNKNKIPHEKYILCQKRCLLFVGVYSAVIGLIWMLTKSTFLEIDRNLNLYPLNLSIFYLVILFLSTKNKLKGV